MMDRMDFIKTAGALATLSVGDLLRWHDDALAQDFDAALAGDWLVHVELIGPTMDDVIAVREVMWSEGSMDTDGTWGTVITIGAHEQFITSGIRYHIHDGGVLEKSRGPKFSPFATMRLLAPGDTLHVHLNIQT